MACFWATSFRKEFIGSRGEARDGLCFHSFRHTVAQRLEAAAVSQTDAARVTGHAIEGQTYGTYSSGLEAPCGRG